MKALINLLLFVVYLLPQWVVFNTGCLIGGLLRIFRFRHSIIESNIIQIFPNYGKSETKTFTKKIYRHFGLLIVEFMRQANYKRLKTGQLVTNDGVEENLGVSVKNGKGVCLLAGHIGNWELAGASLTEQGYETQTVVKEVKGAAGNHLLYCIRDKNGIKTLSRGNAIRDILRTLRDGKIVIFVVDQNMRRGEGIFVDFFGRTASTMTSLATIARKTGAPVLPGSFIRNSDNKSYTLWIGEQIDWIDSGNAKEDIVVNTVKYNKILEQMILRNPEQWIWMHKRWRTRPAKN